MEFLGIEVVYTWRLRRANSSATGGPGEIVVKQLHSARHFSVPNDPVERRDGLLVISDQCQFELISADGSFNAQVPQGFSSDLVPGHLQLKPVHVGLAKSDPGQLP